jgi:hypothetical protein
LAYAAPQARWPPHLAQQQFASFSVVEIDDPMARPPIARRSTIVYDGAAVDADMSHFSKQQGIGIDRIKRVFGPGGRYQL